jgi:hypothetical protein
MVRRPAPDDPEPPPPGGAAVPAARLEERRYPGGRVLLRREPFGVDVLRGEYRLGDALQAPLGDVALLCAGGDLDSLDGILFLDTETTGLVGGAGTFVFLVGLASFRDGEFEVRQWVLPDPAEEEGLLDALEEEARSARGLVSFHGRGFDVPRIEERFLLAGRRSPFCALPHLDLLVGARRVFKLRAGRVNLQHLEELVLGTRRLDDLPGSECPQAWYDYLKGETGPLHRVLEHNLLDLLSLPTLLAALARPAAGHGPSPDVHAAGKVLARAGLRDRALLLQRGAAARAVDAHVAARAHDEASRILRRQRRAAEAAAEALAATMADPSLPGPWLALAKDHEHRTKDFALALECCRRLERILFLRSRSESRRRDLKKRIARIERKLAAAAAASERA